MIREPLTDFEILVKGMLDARKAYSHTHSKMALHRFNDFERLVAERIEERECEANGCLLIRLSNDNYKKWLCGSTTVSTTGD